MSRRYILLQGAERLLLCLARSKDAASTSIAPHTLQVIGFENFGLLIPLYSFADNIFCLLK